MKKYLKKKNKISINLVNNKKYISRSILNNIFPNDYLKKKRINNFYKSYYALNLKYNKKIVGILFIRKLMFIPNVTWIVKKKFQKRGFASKLLQKACKDNFFITAVCRTMISKKLAKKNNFIFIFSSICFYLKIK
jgi:hypothetical protein